jgi:multiple sugar transport system substrate-binding protein
MINRLLAAAAALALAAGAAYAQTEVVVQYPYPDLFNNTMKRISETFAKERADIKMTFRAAYKDYEDGTQRVLREAITGDVPDVTFQGLNRVRIFADKGIAVALDDLFRAEANPDSAGFDQAMRAAGTVNGKIYGLPFAISLPIAFYNVDLIQKAGGNPERLPVTWDEVIALAKRINALGDGTYGVSFEWSITGNWLWQAEVFRNGGTMVNAHESRVAFDGDAGKAAIRTIARLVTEAQSPNLSGADMRTAFAAGKVGVLITSTAYLNTLTKQVDGKFSIKTHVYPGLTPGTSHLPPGGNVAIITAKTVEKQKAAWEALKFFTGAKGGAIMVETTGYMAPNARAADLLKDFYQQNPNQFTAVVQLPYMASWYAFPGENGLKITDVIKDRLQSVMDGKRAGEPERVLADMAADVNALLPKK